MIGRRSVRCDATITSLTERNRRPVLLSRPPRGFFPSCFELSRDVFVRAPPPHPPISPSPIPHRCHPVAILLPHRYHPVSFWCLENCISAAYAGQGDWGNAAADASASVDLNPQYAKGEEATCINPRHHRSRGCTRCLSLALLVSSELEGTVATIKKLGSVF